MIIYIIFNRSIRQNYAWGSHFFEQISKDLKELLPDVKSFSPRNLQYMCQSCSHYPELQIAHQVDSHLIFSIPWGHHKVIMKDGLINVEIDYSAGRGNSGDTK